MLDGARSALLGYLYQLMGVAALRAVGKNTSGTPALLAAVNSGQLVLEMHGQDAVVRIDNTAPSELVALQFKHLSDPGAELDFQDLVEILHGLEMSRREAVAQNELLNRYFLVTNRRLASKPRRVWTARNCLNCPPDLQLVKNTGAKIAEWKASLLKVYARPKAGPGTVTTAKTAARAWWGILRQLELYEDYAFDTGLTLLRDYASAFGVLQAEQDGRLDQLAGALLQQTAAGLVDVSADWLNTHLLGHPQSACLRFGEQRTPHIRDRCTAELSSQIPAVAGVPIDRLVRRDLQSQLQAATVQHSVVFVHGKGGVGKSTETLYYLNSVTDSQLTIRLPAREASEDAIGRTFHQLRVGNSASLPLSEVIDRVAAANGAGSRRVMVALDGVDEVEERTESLNIIRGLISRCWADGDPTHAEFTILISCRSRPGMAGTNERDLIQRWASVAYPEMLLQKFGFVFVDDFTEQELCEAARQSSEVPEGILAAGLNARSNQTTTSSRAAASIPDAVVGALKHPVVWGVYLSLPLAVREQLLRSETSAFDLLAERFLERFFNKCIERGSTAGLQSLWAAMVAVAGSAAPLDRLGSWDGACVNGRYLNPREAAFLFHEAQDYGVIYLESATNWQWRHRFIQDFLARRGQI